MEEANCRQSTQNNLTSFNNINQIGWNSSLVQRWESRDIRNDRCTCCYSDWKSCSLYVTLFLFSFFPLYSSTLNVPLLQFGYCSSVHATLIRNRLEVARLFITWLQDLFFSFVSLTKKCYLIRTTWL